MLHVISIKLLVANNHFNLPTFQYDIMISDTTGEEKVQAITSFVVHMRSLWKPLE